MQKRCKLTSDTRHGIIDALVAEATNNLFYGDTRDGAAPAITLENFLNEMMRHGAIEFRARLSRLSDTKLLAERHRADAHIRTYEERMRDYVKMAEQNELEDAERARRRRQAELGKRHGLQQALLEAARHFCSLKMTAKAAWRAIEQQPFDVGDGSTVIIEDGTMRRRRSDRKRGKSGIKFGYWSKRYWPATGNQ
jgi:hypothetical protein